MTFAIIWHCFYRIDFGTRSKVLGNSTVCRDEPFSECTVPTVSDLYVPKEESVKEQLLVVT